MRTNDLEINRSIRRIFVRHWIDLGRISIRTTNGSSFIHGSLQRIKGFKDDLSTPIVTAMFTDIRRLREVKHVRVELDNWIDSAGTWISRDKAEKTGKAKRDDTHKGIFDIDKQIQDDNKDK